MGLDPTRRFSTRVDDYVRYRPSYPREIIPLLERECGLTPASRVADIGSGPGFLSRLFLDFGCEVFGVEPNADMRHAGERLLASEPRFHSVDGRAEDTKLADAAVDFVTAAQAFHWFDPGPARREFVRILKPAGWVVLVWNERLRSPGLHADYDALIRRYAPERRSVTPDEFTSFFGHSRWRQAKLPNEQRLDWPAFEGRLRSSSYAPLPGAREYQPMMDALERIFTAFQAGGLVTLGYDTEIYYGRLAGPEK